MVMMRWPPWSVATSRKFEVVIVVHRVEGLNLVESDRKEEMGGGKKRVVVEVKWKGQKSKGLVSLRRSVRRNITEDGGAYGGGVVEWNEEFKNVCAFSSTSKDEFFFPWEVEFRVISGSNIGSKNKPHVVGSALLNLAQYVISAEEKVGRVDVNVPVKPHKGPVDSNLALYLSLKFTSLECSQESPSPNPKSVDPLSLSPPTDEAFLAADESPSSTLKAGLKKMKSFANYISSRGTKKSPGHDVTSSEGRRSSGRSDDTTPYDYPFDTDSLDDNAAGEADSDDSNELTSVRTSVGYETLACANRAGGCGLIGNMRDEDEGLVYYSNRERDSGFCSGLDSLIGSSSSSCEQSPRRSSRRRILNWRKRKLSFRSSIKKGEPLLKKDCREDGGDDIDFDRRQLSSSDESWYGMRRSTDSDFGDDDCFAVGSWVSKEVTSRDGSMKLQTEVFFASIDQRNERAAGESACTALVAVIANWLQSNREETPIKSEFDRLIRSGSLEWRNLCENDDYKQRFPDKHFDLDTILQAEICPLRVAPEKSFIGFFHPEGLEEGGEFDFLHGAMSFDSIWDEISNHELNRSSYTDTTPFVYIVSWNDHFFVLKVEKDAYYIIDTLGERLYEGCNQAYILKFDKDTRIERLGQDEKKPADVVVVVSDNDDDESEKSEKFEVCKGKDSCKEYIKNFLAAIPVRELLADVKNGRMTSTLVHHRLQIEFHYTQVLEPVVKEMTVEAVGDDNGVRHCVE